MNGIRVSDAPFEVRTCELVTISTGLHARTIGELRQAVSIVSEGCLHYHFWGRRLRPQTGETEYFNDFAEWIARSLRDITLAERLSAVNPEEHETLEGVRRAVLGRIDERMDEDDSLTWAKSDHPFFFIRAQMLIFPTEKRFSSVEELPDAVKTFDRGSVFYHIIDARRRTTTKEDDISSWLSGFGDETDALRRKLKSIDPFIFTLGQLREEIVSALQKNGAGAERGESL